MIGKNHIEIGPVEFVKGMSTSANLSDGGFSSESININPIAYPGQIWSSGAVTDASTNLVGEIIASCPAIDTGNTRVFVDTSKKYYTFDGSTLTLQATDGSSNTYTNSKTDMVSWLGSFYYTSTTTDITRWDGTSSLTTAYWTSTLSQSALQSSRGEPHPLLTYSNALWVGDRNALHQIKSDSTVSLGKLILGKDATGTLANDLTEEIIMALGIDPASGKMLISTTSSANLSGVKPTNYTLYLYDGASVKPSRIIPVDDLITAFYNVGSTVFCVYGKNLGYFNGSGITFLRKLSNITYTSTSLIYKHRITAIGNTLYVVDGKNIIAYGEIEGGKPKVFYCPLQNPVNTNAFSLIASAGENKLCMAFATSKLYTFSTTSTSNFISTGATFYTNKINFPRPVRPRFIRLFFDKDLTLVTDSQYGQLSLATDNQDFGTDTFSFSSTTANKKFVDVPVEPDEDTNTVQLKLSMLATTSVNNTYGLRKMVLFYDVVE